MTDRETVLDWIDDAREDLVEFLLEFGNVPSPRGREGEAGRFLAEWLTDQGLDARLQPVVGDRANVVATLSGEQSGDGESLVFNGHIDTAHGDPEEDGQVLVDQPKAYRESWRDGPFLKGDDVVNDKGPLGAQVFAALALDRAGISLSGDLHVTGVVGEISGTTVVEFQDRERYAGTGLGTRHLVDSGVTGDYALVAECTDFAVARMECGVVWFEITVESPAAGAYHPLQARPDVDPGDRQGAVTDLARTTLALEEWAGEYPSEHTREYDHGTVTPTAGVGAVRAGKPYAPAAAPRTGTVYLDVRLPPGETVEFARREVEAVLDDLNVDATVEPYLFRRGYVADVEGVAGLTNPLEDAHEAVRGAEPDPPAPHVTSMWRDSNVFNEAGIPSVNFGPPRAPEAFPDSDLSDAVRIDDLIAAAKIYALTALDVCG
ncbi:MULTISPECIES: M20 family metallopeptidase [Salinibaculum]|uniref:M20 family metallopeptidase n=1 Tax=Salinibaculum TaxID=2732368 RepID=UPI0030CAE043